MWVLTDGWCFVEGNWLCVRELLNVLAANGEQGELGSGWCSGSWALRVFRGVRFWCVPSMFWVVFLEGSGVLGYVCVVHVWAVSCLAGSWGAL